MYRLGGKWLFSQQLFSYWTETPNIYISEPLKRKQRISGSRNEQTLRATSQPPSLSGGICYIWWSPSPFLSRLVSPPPCASMLCFVAPQLAALLAPTNLFSTLITARQQAAVQWAGQMKGSNLPITGGLPPAPTTTSFLVGVISDRTTMDLRFLFFSFFSPSSAPG